MTLISTHTADSISVLSCSGKDCCHPASMTAAVCAVCGYSGLDERGLKYVVGISHTTVVYPPNAKFALPKGPMQSYFFATRVRTAHSHSRGNAPGQEQ